MSITTELREWIQQIWDLPKTQSTLLSIADRIDAEHERLMHEQTVKSILADMLDEWGELPSDQPADKIIAKYAAKLQLKEDE